MAHAEEDARAEAQRIAHDLEGDARVDPDSQLVALIAYLQRLGREEPRYPSEHDETPHGLEVSRAPTGGTR